VGKRPDHRGTADSVLIRETPDAPGASVALVDLQRVERRLQERLDALGPAPRAELLHVLVLPDFERADRIGSYWGNPKTRTFAELLIDCEEDRTCGRCWWGCCGRPIAKCRNAGGWLRPRSHLPASSARRSLLPRRREGGLIGLPLTSC
jgi:hypothetical protein